MADALDYAHRRGVLHRDIKPSNLLLDALGNAWVTDFGLAKVQSTDGLTQASAVVGTLRYMAPERFAGRSSRKGDLYALGATLYEMLALRPAYEGHDQLELMASIREGRVEPLRRVDGRMPRDLETIVHKAMAHDPADRYPTGAALADDLRNFLARRPIRARRASYSERFLLWCKRNPGLAASNIAAATLTTALAIGSTVAALSYRSGLHRVERAERQGRLVLFEALTSRARAGRFSHRIGQRFESLDALQQAARIGHELGLPADRLDVLRDEAIAALALPDLKSVGRRLPAPPVNMVDRCFDPALSRYAELFRDGEIVVRRLADDRELARVRLRSGNAANLNIVEFSPDGRYLACTNHAPDYGLTVWDVGRGTVALDDPGPVSGHAAGFSPDGRGLVLVRVDGQLRVYDLDSGRLSRSWSSGLDASGVGVDPEGRLVAVSGSRKETNQPVCDVFDLSTGRVEQTIPLSSPAGQPIWSPGRLSLGLPQADSAISLWSMVRTPGPKPLWDDPADTPRRVLTGHTNGGVYGSFDPTGTLLASNSWSGFLRLWEPQLGRVIFEVPGNHARFSPDGRIALHDLHGGRFYQSEPALEYRTLARSSAWPSTYWEPAVHPDGRLLVVGTWDGLLLWDLANGAEVGRVFLGTSFTARFDGRGENLLTFGSLGACRWKVRVDATAGTVAIGPPEPIPGLPVVQTRLASDRSGRVVALPRFWEATVVAPGRELHLGPLNNNRNVDVSTDGEWLATSSHEGGGVQVWRLADGSNVAEFPLGGIASALFSPDNRWLCVNGSGMCRLVEFGTWKELYTVNGKGIAFAPDGRTLVVDEERVLHLVECATRRTLARFESPDPCAVELAAFSPDGSRFVFTTQEGPAVHIWDLRRVRQRLAEMGLDWGAPPLPGGDPALVGDPILRLDRVDYGPFSEDPEQLAISPQGLIKRLNERLGRHPDDADAYHHRAHALVRLGRDAEALSDFDRALALRPGDAHLLIHRAWDFLRLGQLPRAAADVEAALAIVPEPAGALGRDLADLSNNVGWRLLIGPTAGRDPERALALARRSVKLNPLEHSARNSLALALYRLGRPAEAAELLEAAVPAGWGSAFDLFVRAMVRHGLGQVDASRRDLSAAVRSMEAYPPTDARLGDQLRALRAETESVMAGPPAELPADVFAP